MAGRIHDEDIAAVRERVRIDEVVREYVTLKSAGGGSLKGLCPFHDERSPSFHVTPSRGMYYCFGCGEGGDALGFVQKIDHLTFVEAVEKLADKVGIQLRYIEGGAAKQRSAGQRTRIIEANKKAAQFYREQLATPAAEVGRAFLHERGFDQQAIEHFGVGFAPKGWDSLITYLRGQGFTEEEMLAAGLVSQGNRGTYDRFRGRLIWPIRDLGGDVVGFGARKLFDDDDGPKYLNTPETAAYKKSQVLYGLDVARKEIAKSQQAVIVEGYTDVMAAHLAGVTTAVATCGTSFGADHIKVLRRLLMDDEHMRGQVVFTFDGDAAGQKAAMRAFGEDQRFMAHTFAAVEPNGLDPCDLRMQRGDAAVRELIDAKVPLFEFAIRSVLSAYDLNSAEGRVAALRETAPIVASIKDPVLRPEYARRLAGWLGLNEKDVLGAMGGAGSRSATSSSLPVSSNTSARSLPADPALRVEREVLKSALQYPHLVVEWYASLEPAAFTHEKARAVHEAIVAAGGPTGNAEGLAWIDAVMENCSDDSERNIVRELAVEPIPADDATVERYAISMIARLLDIDAGRRAEELRGRMQRSEDQSPLLAELLALDEYRRSLRALALGEA